MKYLLIISILISCEMPGEENFRPGKVTIEKRLPQGHKVCVIGDSGKKSIGQELVAQALNQEGCDQIRHTGDIIYPNGLSDADDPEFNERFYHYYKPLMDKGVPFYMSMGNHDYHKKPDAWLELAKRFDMIKFPSRYYLNIYGDLCFLMIDTNARLISQMSWMKELKEQYSNTCKGILAFGHHPRYSSGKHGNAKFFIKEFLKRSIEGEVHAYFAGHEHNQEDYGKVNGTHFFVSGGAGEARKLKKTPPLWAQSSLGYQVFTIHYNNNIPYLRFTFYSVDTDGVKKVEHTGEVNFD